ncbi:MAG: tetratricopeptide repeat protein, partial [Planctomycetota bacterium]
MAEEKQQSTPEEDASEEAVEQPSSQENTHEERLEADPASTEVREELSEREVFAGDEDFYESLVNSEDPKTGVSGTEDNVRPTPEVGSVSPATSIPPQVFVRRTSFSMLEKVLVVSIVAIGAMLLYAMLRYTSGSAAENVRAQSNQRMLASERPVENPVQSVPREPTEKAREPETVLSPAQPLSLKVAQDFYLGRDYDKAYAAYAELHQNLAAGEENELLRDFLQLRMALCTKEAADFDQSGRLFGVVSESRSLAVRVVANYHLSLLEMRNRHYLRARTRAYQTITLIGAVDFDPDWALSVQRDCQFLVAEALTRSVLLLCDADKDLPEDLWMEPCTNGKSDKTDPFTDLNEEELSAFLSSGSDKLSKALLGPQIRKLENQSGPPRWSVACNRASIEELLARFAANAGLDIHWAASETQAAHEAEDIVRNRAVRLYMPAVTSQQFVTAAAGSVGLLALLDDKGTASIYNPAAYTSLSNHVALLGKEAVSVWQRFLLAFHDDEYVPNAHFALGLLHAQRDQLIDAVAEYRLVANR